MSLKNILKLSGLFRFLIVLCLAVSAQVPPIKNWRECSITTGARHST